MTAHPTRADLERRAAELTAARTPFVAATVARAARPASVCPGDRALVLGDGRVEGFVGGACAETAVRLHAAHALETGEPLLMRILPGDEEAPAEDGAVTVRNPCVSGGAMEIFLEPRLPSPRVLVVGDTPTAGALAGLGERLGYDVVALDFEALAGEADAAALVVASHGREEVRPLAWALGECIPYVGLVASRARGASVLAALREAGVAEPQLARVRTPAGLDLGARGPEEVALSILAEIVATLRRAEPAFAGTTAAPAVAGTPAPPAVAHGPAPAPLAAMPAEGSLDPVCGMVVPVASAAPRLVHEGRTVVFCGEGCRRAFEAAPERYVASV